MRAHAHVEDHIGRLKDSGLLRFPFTDFAANAAWLAVVCWGSGPGPLVPAALCHRAPGPGAAQTAALATVAHTRPHRFVKPEATSSASSTDGPPPPTSSPPTDHVRRPHLTGAPLQSRTPAVEQPRPHAPRTSPPAPPEPRHTPISQPTPHHNPNHPSTPTNQTSRE